MPDIPEHLRRRSAEARAKALGVPLEQVLAEMGLSAEGTTPLEAIEEVTGGVSPDVAGTTIPEDLRTREAAAREKALGGPAAPGTPAPAPAEPAPEVEVPAAPTPVVEVPAAPAPVGRGTGSCCCRACSGRGRACSSRGGCVGDPGGFVTSFGRGEGQSDRPSGGGDPGGDDRRGNSCSTRPGCRARRTRSGGRGTCCCCCRAAPAAAAASAIPEALLRRSAEAKAKATGRPVDEILAEMTGVSSPAPIVAEPAPEPTPPPNRQLRPQRRPPRRPRWKSRQPNNRLRLQKPGAPQPSPPHRWYRRRVRPKGFVPNAC